MNCFLVSITHVETGKRKAVILFKKIQETNPISNMIGNYGNRCLITIVIIHSKHFPVSDWVKPHALFTITSG